MVECLMLVLSIVAASIALSTAKAEEPLKLFTQEEVRLLRKSDDTFAKCWTDRPMGEPADTPPLLVTSGVVTPRILTEPYCTCLYQAREGDQSMHPSKFPTGEKENFCRLHAMLVAKPSQIASAAAKNGEKAVEGKNFATEGHQDVDIQNKLCGKELFFPESTLTWNRLDSQLVFEGPKNVQLQSARISYAAKINDKAEKSFVGFEGKGSFKVTAKIKSRSLRADTIDNKGYACDVTVDNFLIDFPYLRKPHTDREAVVLPALGTKETISAALIKSFCAHFKTALSSALEDLNKGKGGKKLTDLMNYGI